MHLCVPSAEHSTECGFSQEQELLEGREKLSELGIFTSSVSVSAMILLCWSFLEDNQEVTENEPKGAEMLCEQIDSSSQVNNNW